MDLWLSVIIPVYNGEKYISDMMQAFKSQWMDGVELILVDDGSSDGSLAVMQSWAKREDMCVHALHQENAGASAARNFGMDHARGRCIAFVDVDDLIAPYYLNSLYEAAQTGGFDALIFEKTRAREGETPFGSENVRLSLARITPEDQLDMFLRNPTRYGVYDLLIDREYLLRAGLRYPEGYAYYEDYDFFVRTIAGTDRLLYTDAQLYCYMLRPGSAMMRFNNKRLECMQLFGPLMETLEKQRPKSAKRFQKWFAARIYWSILWQAAAAMPELSDVRRFADESGANLYFRQLRDYPDPKVKFTAQLYRICPAAYFRAARSIGRRRSLVRTVK